MSQGGRLSLRGRDYSRPGCTHDFITNVACYVSGIIEKLVSWFINCMSIFVLSGLTISVHAYEAPSLLAICPNAS